MTRNTTGQNGFSLVELTIVLVIVALLSSGLMFGLSAQNSTATNRDARNQLDNVKEALFGFAMTNGRLPCPANPALASSDVGAGIENCGLPKPDHGVVPWVTLGLPETDPWGQRLTYFVSTKFSVPLITGTSCSFTLDTGVKKPDGTSDTAGLADIYNLTNSDGTPGTKIAIDIAAVIVSHGKRSAGAYLSDGTKIPGDSKSDEFKNSNGTQTFVASTPTPDFDDQLVWISQHILKSRMVAVGKLP